MDNYDPPWEMRFLAFVGIIGMALGGPLLLIYWGVPKDYCLLAWLPTFYIVGGAISKGGAWIHSAREALISRAVDRKLGSDGDHRQGL